MASRKTIVCVCVFLFFFFTIAKTSPVKTQGLCRIASSICTLEIKPNKSFSSALLCWYECPIWSPREAKGYSTSVVEIVVC